MQRVDCALCGVDCTRLFNKIGNWNIVRCKNCGLVYLNPRPSKKELDELYVKDYFTNDLLQVFPTAKKEIEQGISMYLERVRSLKCNTGKLLEIGCGNGFFLKAAEKLGWEVMGIEISQWVSRYCSEKLGLKILNAKLEDLELKKGCFDVVALFHNLEHQRDPLDILRRIKELLKGNGLLVIAVPNINSFDRIYYRKDWKDYSLPVHLYHFSTRTLTKMLNIAGFKVVRKEYTAFCFIKELLQKFIIKSNKSSEENGTVVATEKYNFMRLYELYKLTIGKIPFGSHMIFYAKNKVKKIKEIKSLK